MCGIVGYVGYREAYPILINGLKRLEYRGYDSAGIALLNGNFEIYKKKGNVRDLEESIQRPGSATIGIGHTRWATHGPPNDQNAHPHLSNAGLFAIIHNGIIENYAELKKRLFTRGYTFQSDTDTEVLVNLIEEIYQVGSLSPEEAVRLAMMKAQGTLGILLLTKEYPQQIIAARRSSPLVIGIGEGEYFIASDVMPIIEHTRNVVYLNDEDIAIIQPNELSIKTSKNAIQIPFIQQLSLELDAIEKGGYEHFMLKEIFEQPKSIQDTMRGRINAQEGYIKLGGLTDVLERITQARRIIILGCGTSWHAGLVGEYLIEELARLPVEVEYASEFRYRNPVLFEDDVILAISQSGETADTLAAVQLARQSNLLVLGICNVVGSSLPRLTNAGVYTHAGPEIGVASTKAFTSQVTALVLIALLLAEKRNTLPCEKIKAHIQSLIRLPELVEQTLQQTNSNTQELAELYKNATNFLYLGRGYNFPVALEGALKLKEISYIHAEGYPAAEMKHGPIALIDENMPVVVIATRDKSYEKIISNIQEVKARKGKVIAVVSNGDSKIRNLADHILEIPLTEDILTPILAVIPLQLLAYYIAVLRGCNVDQPRNLAKSVTVE
ncbi:MAG: glutamine--fructose-6-phosphate transaminase (isomerizing) [Bacteroidia bacterium]|nr:glutamine--fructose-6-phosphate transaminase (isomerizing) [Bacteroidia bacterium]MDW8157655.1 glutamine--fructose-6-phosphate transaminase (isomerizing) [Bacteroidia bacterium]